MEQSQLAMNIRRAAGMAIVTVSVTATGVVGQVQDETSHPARAYQRQAEAYDLFLQSLRLENSGDITRAIEVLNRAAELDVEAAAIPAAQASLYARLNRATAAIKAAEHALVLDADYGDAHRVLGLTFAALSEQAAQQPASQRSPDAETYRRRALTHLEQAVAADVFDARITFSLARLYVETGEFDEAVATLEPFVRERQEFVDGLLLLSRAYAGSGRLAEATEVLEEAVRRQPRSVRMLSALAELYQAEGRWPEAADAYERAAARRPSDLNLKRRWVALLLNAGDQERARGVIREVVEARPEDGRALYLLSEVERRLNNFGAAEAAVRRVMALEPNSARGFFQLGAIFEQQARYADAEQAFRAALERDPLDHQTLNYLGYMLADRGERLNESVALIQRALASDPHNGSYLDSLGWAYFKLEEWELAETYLRQASEQLSQNSVIQDHFGDLLFRRGRYVEAVEAWERALRGDADSIDPAVIKRKIEDGKERARR